MNTIQSKRIAVFGLPGSGKSTFADKLGKMMDLPVHHIDRYFFHPGWIPIDKNEFMTIQKKLVANDSWIIEGNSIKTLEVRFARADTVIYFQFSRLLCLWRVFKRRFIHDKSIKDIPDGCSKSDVSLELLKYLWTFKTEKTEHIEELRQKYPQTTFIVLKTSKEADDFFLHFG